MPLRTIRSGVTNHPEKSVLQFVTDNIRQGGIISGFNATEKAGTVDMSVDIHPGTIYAKGTGNAYPISLDTIANVPITLNSSANPLIGVVICFVNLNITPDPDGEGSDVPQFAYIAGLPLADPVPPSIEDIASTIGTTNPFEIICQINVGSQVTAITNENITDMRRRAYIKPSKTISQQTVSGNVGLDAGLADNFELTMEGNIVLQPPTNMLIGDWIYVTLRQDTVGTRTADFSAFTTMSADMSLSTGNNRISSFAIERAPSAYRIYSAGKQF